MTLHRRILVTAIGVGLSFVVLSPVALAGVDPPGACDGSATIAGVTYTPSNDTPGNPVVVPADEEGLQIPYQGSVTFENMGHEGEIRLLFPIESIVVARWSDPNTGDERSASGTYSLDQFWDELGGLRITGMYALEGTHSASGGSCTGFVIVEFTGNPLGTPICIVVTVIGSIALVGLVWAGVPRKGG
ncbi:MAG TPA: hypothetical protein VIL12_06200 [Acidimicrobiia bacterium]